MKTPKLPRPRLRRGAAAEPETGDAAPKAAAPGSAGATARAGATAASSATARPVTPAAPATPARPPTTEERLDGLGSWLAQVDRKLGIRTYALGAALVLSLAAAGVGLVLVLQLRDDAATKDDIQALIEQVSAVEDSAVAAAAEDVEAVGDRITQLEQRFATLQGDQTAGEQQVTALQNDITDLEEQIATLETDVASIPDPIPRP